MINRHKKKIQNTSFLAAISIVLTLSFLLSCGPKGPAANIPETITANTAKVSEPAAKSGWEADWDKTIQAAKKEGKVIVYSSSGGDVPKALSSRFQEKYGILVDILVLPGGETSTKIVRERKAGIFLADVIIGGNTPFINELKPAGALSKLEPEIILPEVKDPKLWWSGGIHFIDKDRFVAAFTAFNQPPIAYNINLVKPQEIKTYLDLLEPRWKGKIVLADPTVPGSPSKWSGVIVTSKLGADYLRQLARHDLVIIRDQRLQVEWLAQGKYPLAIVPKSDITSQFQKAGAPIEIKNTEDGIYYLSTGGGNLALISNAPHPNAARVFVNWLLSKDGGIVHQQAIGRPSGRLDVPKDSMHPLTLLPPGIKEMPAETEEFLLREKELYPIFKDIFGSR